MTLALLERGLLQRLADDLRIGAVDDQVLRRRDRNLESLAAQSGDVVAQPVGIGRPHRSEFLHADLNRAGEVADFFLRALDDRLLGAETDDHLRAQRQREQTDHQEDQLGLQIQRWESICHWECAPRHLFQLNSGSLQRGRQIASSRPLRFWLRWLKGVSQPSGSGRSRRTMRSRSRALSGNRRCSGSLFRSARRRRIRA